MTLQSKPLCRFSWKWFTVIITWLEWFFMVPSITVPSNLWQAWNVCPPPDKAGRTQYFPHRLKKKNFLKKKEKMNSLIKHFRLSVHQAFCSCCVTHICIIYCCKLSKLKQIYYFKIKTLSPGDLKMLISENGGGRVLIFCCLSFFFAKSNSWVILHCFEIFGNTPVYIDFAAVKPAVCFLGMQSQLY